ncbi:MAG: hypothetical protein ACRDWH_01340 [Acidimicrobiia bacterium]
MHTNSLLAVVVALAVAACADSAATTTTTSLPITTASASTTTTVETTSTTSSTAGTTTTTIDDNVEVPRIKVEDGVKTEGLDTLSVRVGETIRFEVEADVADEVHVHGFDLHFDTVPGEEIVVEFLAEATGIFEVELESAGLHILDIEVTP